MASNGSKSGLAAIILGISLIAGLALGDICW